MMLALQSLGLLPLVVGLALFRWRRCRGRSALDSLVDAAVLLVGGIWLLANGLSLFGALQPGPLRVVWAIAGVIAAFALWRWRRVDGQIPGPIDRVEKLLGIAIAALLLVTLVRAVVAPPNTVDALNYHLPRQVMWLQQGGLDPYETVNDRENMMPPLAEIVGLQFLALTGDDYWANLPQWFAYAGLALALALLARRLGASRQAALGAALLGLLVPMAYHEASNAKNDLFATFWLVILAVRLVPWREATFKPSRADAAGIAVAAALACLTKSTALVYAPLLGLVALWPWLRRSNGMARARTLLLALLVWLTLVAPFHLRNQAWYGSPLGQHQGKDGGAQTNEAMGPRLLVSNILRHATLHLLGPMPDWNEAWVNVVKKAHDGMGADLNDPRVTLWILKFSPDYSPAAEMVAGAPAHFILGVPLLLAIAGGMIGGGNGSRARWLAIFVLLGALAFCAIVKWQLWAARLQLPLFSLGAVAVVVAVDGWPARARRLGALLGIALALLAWWPGADTEERPLWTKPSLWNFSRDANFYRVFPILEAREASLVELVQRSGVHSLYLHNLHDISYPVTRRLRKQVAGLRFSGAPAGYLFESPPEGVLMLSLGAPLALYMEFAGRSDWRLVGRGVGAGLYLPEPRVRELGMWHELPAYAGWVRHVGLPTFDLPLSNGQSVIVRDFPTGEGSLAYEARGRQLTLKAGVLRLDRASRELLTLFVKVGGVVIAGVDLAPTENEQMFEVVVPGRVGPHVIEISGGQRAAGKLRFTQMQIVDENPGRE